MDYGNTTAFFAPPGFNQSPPAVPSLGTPWSQPVYMPTATVYVPTGTVTVQQAAPLQAPLQLQAQPQPVAYNLYTPAYTAPFLPSGYLCPAGQYATGDIVVQQPTAQQQLQQHLEQPLQQQQQVLFNQQLLGQQCQQQAPGLQQPPGPQLQQQPAPLVTQKPQEQDPAGQSDDVDDLLDILDQVERQHAERQQQQLQQEEQEQVALQDNPGDMASRPRPYEVGYDRAKHAGSRPPYLADGGPAGGHHMRHPQEQLHHRDHQRQWLNGGCVYPPGLPGHQPLPWLQPPLPYGQPHPFGVPPWGPGPPLSRAPPAVFAAGGSRQPAPPHHVQQHDHATAGRLRGKIKLRTKPSGHAAATAIARQSAEAARPGTAAAAAAETPNRTASSGQPSASARAAALQLQQQHAMAASGASAAGSASKNTPEQYFRRHVPLIDAFWASAIADDVGLVAVAHMPPASAAAAAAAPDGQQVLSCSMNVALTSAQVNMLKNKTATLQLVCLLVGDPVPHRCQWPGSAHLTVNGSRVPLKLAKRMHSQKLKPMQVDLPADITSHVAGEATSVQLSGLPSGMGYVLGARLVRQQGLERVKQMMCQPPSLEAALADVKQKMTGDGEVEVSATTISLRCPLSACRITAPARFACSSGLACASCFDLNSFLEMAMRTGKWQCPVTSCLVTVGQLQLEPYLAAVLKALKAADLLDSVEEVEVAPDGKWRPKGAASGLSCPWFSVLIPPSPSALREAFRGPAGGGIKRRRAVDDHGAAAAVGGGGAGGLQQQDAELQRRSKQQRQGSSPGWKAAGASGAAAAAAGGKDDCVDLTFDSDDEAPAVAKPAARPKTATAPGRGSPAGGAAAGGGASGQGMLIRLAPMPRLAARRPRGQLSLRPAVPVTPTYGADDDSGLFGEIEDYLQGSDDLDLGLELGDGSEDDLDEVPEDLDTSDTESEEPGNGDGSDGVTQQLRLMRQVFSHGAVGLSVLQQRLQQRQRQQGRRQAAAAAGGRGLTRDTLAGRSNEQGSCGSADGVRQPPQQLHRRPAVSIEGRVAQQALHQQQQQHRPLIAAGASVRAKQGSLTQPAAAAAVDECEVIVISDSDN